MANLTPFELTRDVNGYNGFGLKPTNQAYSGTLAASTDTSLTIPTIDALGMSSSTSKARLIAIINADPGASVWVALNATAEVPAGASFAATLSALNPAAYEVKCGDILHFITAATGVSVSIRLYWLTS